MPHGRTHCGKSTAADQRCLRGRLRLGLLCMGMAWTGLWPLTAQAASGDVTADFVKSRQMARLAEKEFERLKLAKLRACEESDQADLALLRSDATTGPVLQGLAKSAREKSADCARQGELVRLGKPERDEAVENMRRLAVVLATCQIAGSCATTGLTLGTATPSAPATAPSAPAVLTATAAGHQAPKSNPTTDEVGQLAERAEGAQDEVDGLRNKAKTVYDLGDTALAAAVGVDLAKLHASVKKPDLYSSAEQTAQITPKELRRLVGVAQRAADALVARTLELKVCTDKIDTCRGEAYAAGLQEQGRLDEAKKAFENGLEKLTLAGYTLSSLKLKPDLKSDQLSAAVELRNLLDTNPTVKSFFGEDALGLNVSGDTKQVSLRWGGVTRLFNGLDRFTAVVSTAPGDTGLGALTSNNGGVTTGSSLKLGWHRMRSENRAGPFIFDYALGVGVERVTKEYLTQSKPLALDSTTLTYTVPSVGGQLAFLLPKEKNLLLLSMDIKRGREDQKKAIRCPVDPAADASLVTCTNGPLGAPKQQYTRSFGLEARSLYDQWGYGLKVTYERDPKVNYVAEMPIYLLKSGDGKNFIGGFKLNWQTGQAGLNYGLFVSLPLNLNKPDRE